MDLLPALNVDGFYAHKKPWHGDLFFLIPDRLTQVNRLINDINTRLTHPPSAAHQLLYTRFSSAYFWQNIASHRNAAEAQKIWENTHMLIYADSKDLVWLIDYAFPLLEEYLNCAQKEGEVLKQQAQDSIWQAYLPGQSDYLQGVAQLGLQLDALNSPLQKLKQQWAIATQLKIEQHNDLLKYIATRIDEPCDFTSVDILDSNTLMFLRQASPKNQFKFPQKLLDKNPPIISLLEADKSWQNLSHRLRELKLKYRLTAPQSPATYPHLFAFFEKAQWPSAYGVKLYFIQEIIRYATLPLFLVLFLNGWLSLSSLLISVVFSVSYPWLAQLATQIRHQWQRFDHILISATQGFFHDYLIEQTEYIETIERSALWRKNRLAPGCYEINSFDPSLIISAYDHFQQTLQAQINQLKVARPPVWQIWRYPTLTLINDLIAELTLEKNQATQTMQLYADNIASRLDRPIFSPLPNFLEKITLFVMRFAPDSAHKLNLENQAIRFFLSCVVESANSPILLKRALVTPTGFATHCPDVVAIRSLVNQIRPFIKNSQKLQAVVALAKLLRQEQMISPCQVENYAEMLSSPQFTADKIKSAIQDNLHATFTAKYPNLKNFFTPQQNNAFDDWLLAKKPDIHQALTCVKTFLALPDNQDWSLLPKDFPLVSSERLQLYLTLIELSGISTIRQELQQKIILLAPNYTGAPSLITLWLMTVWPENCPATLDEIVLQARFNWTLETLSTQNNLEPLESFIQDANLALPRADNDHRLARALVNQSCFYLPWHANTQKALGQLEEKGLLLPNAKAAYSQKALHEWLLKP
jgi:hypothetical protein